VTTFDLISSLEWSLFITYFEGNRHIVVRGRIRNQQQQRSISDLAKCVIASVLKANV